MQEQPLLEEKETSEEKESSNGQLPASNEQPLTTDVPLTKTSDPALDPLEPLEPTPESPIVETTSSVFYGVTSSCEPSTSKPIAESTSATEKTEKVESPGKDEKKLKIDWIPITSIVVALLSLVVSLWFNKTQWERTNMPDIVLKEAYLVSFQEVDLEVFRSQFQDVKYLDLFPALHNYEPLIYPYFKDESFTGKHRVYSELQLQDAENQQSFSQTKIMVTPKDVCDELQVLGISPEEAKKRFSIFQRFMFEFKFKNVGKLPANHAKLEIIAEGKQGDENFSLGRTLFTPVEVVAESEFVSNAPFPFPADLPLPDKMFFWVKISWQFDGKQFPTKIHKLTFVRQINGFGWSED